MCEKEGPGIIPTTVTNREKRTTFVVDRKEKKIPMKLGTH